MSATARQFVPATARVKPSIAEVSLVADFLRGSSSCVITGAGLSTESGIPDYRSPQGSYSLGHKPLTHQEFTSSLKLRKRYWARAVAASGAFQRAQPNKGHLSLARLEQGGYLSPGIVTQNVDRLLHKAGAQRVLELHGHADGVRCLSCGHESERNVFQDKVRDMNINWFAPRLSKAGASDEEMRADGDAQMDTSDMEQFQVPGCEKCGGVLMPTIVFFGGNVPQHIRDESFSMIDECDKVLVVGTSLATWSSFRLCKAAQEQGKEILVINAGDTRADPIAWNKLDSVAGGPLLSAVSDVLCD